MTQISETQFFFELTPERVLQAVETSGLLCTGRCLTLNSFENRVYDIEVEDQEGRTSHRVAKFYRPGRWTRQQIREEHGFLLDLIEQEIPVIAPLAFSDGETLKKTDFGIHFVLFPRVGGRAPEEFSDEQLQRVGRLLARIHNVGAVKKAEHRLELTPETYGKNNLEYLLGANWVPRDVKSRFEAAGREIIESAHQLYQGVPLQRIHGDCHLGNLLWSNQGPFFLDFDDMVRGPVVQDVWLLLSGRDEEALRQRDVLLSAYEEMRDFDRSQLRLIEVLRALRYIHYTAWLARRWEDPAFPRAFPQFNSSRYWQQETEDLEEQAVLIRGLVRGQT